MTQDKLIAKPCRFILGLYRPAPAETEVPAYGPHQLD